MINLRQHQLFPNNRDENLLLQHFKPCYCLASGSREQQQKHLLAVRVKCASCSNKSSGVQTVKQPDSMTAVRIGCRSRCYDGSTLPLVRANSVLTTTIIKHLPPLLLLQLAGHGHVRVVDLATLPLPKLITYPQTIITITFLPQTSTSDEQTSTPRACCRSQAGPNLQPPSAINGYNYTHTHTRGGVRGGKLGCTIEAITTPPSPLKP